MTIEYCADVNGILAEMLVNEGQHVEVRKPFLAYATDQNEYNAYFDGKREAMMDAAKLKAAQEVLEETQREKTKKEQQSAELTPMVMLRHVKHLIQRGELDGDSDFAEKLQGLIISGDKALVNLFGASFDGSAFNEDTFDNKFFLENAKTIVDSSK